MFSLVCFLYLTLDDSTGQLHGNGPTAISTQEIEQGSSVSIMICGGILHNVTNLVHNACVMSVLVLIVGWIVGQSCYGVGGYMACGIPLIWSANRNGSGIPFQFISVKAYLPATVNCQQH